MAAEGKVIHVEFGPGGGRRIAPPAPEVQAESVEARTRRRDPIGDLYARAEVARLFGIPESRLRYWERSGFLPPTGASGARKLYTFQDLIGIRAAKGLLERGVTIRKVRKTVEALRRTLPNVVRPLTELRVVADGQEVVVQTDRTRWAPTTGQLMLDFDVSGLREEVVRVLRPATLDPDRRRAAYEAYLEGCRYDEDEVTMDRAEAAYRRAITLDASLAHALTNLGNLRFRRGDVGEAETLYKRALAIDAAQPEAWYNLGFLAYERADAQDAAELFDRAIASDPSFADAHFNRAMALEDLGRGREAREHWQAYIALDPTGRWADIARRHLG
jgi:tetratricopeptide (TPR) repeat protein